MFTPSIVLLMIINTVAASGAVFVALQASALETGDRVSASTASAPHPLGGGYVAAIHRARRRSRRVGRRRSLFSRSSLRAHGSHRHALGEPALHGRGSGYGRSNRWRAAATRHQPSSPEQVIDGWRYFGYPLLSLAEMPKIEVVLIDSDRPPQGCGEVPLAPVAPTVAYAIYKATKTRVRSMPFESSRKS
jgi:hypothetical protein